MIKVAPDHLPEGQDYKTQVPVGTRKIHDEVEEVSFSLWVSNNCILASHPATKTVMEEIQSWNSVMELDVEIPLFSNEKRKRIYPLIR